MKTIPGNMLDIKSGILCHQVNCKKVAGAGLALQIRRVYPVWYQDYLNHTPSLGTTLITRVSNTLYVASLYAQDGYGRDKTYTNYSMFKSCLQPLKFLQSYEIYFPYGIGCGLAGGEWSVIYNTISSELPHATIIKL
jgi:hypothetical protein